MPRSLACPHCHKAVRLTKTVTGPAKARCPHCRQPFRIPAPARTDEPVEVEPIDEEILDVVPAAEKQRDPAPVAETALEVEPVDETPREAVPVAEKVLEVVPVKDKPRAERPARRKPRFADDAPVSPRKRHPTNRAVVVCAVVAGLAAFGWLVSILRLANLVTDTSASAVLALAFVGSLFGGMCASSLTGVARFRHSLYAGLWASGAMLAVAAPLALLMAWSSSQLHEMASGKEGEESAVLAAMEGQLGTIALCLVLAPVLMVTGFLLGGGLDTLVTTVARGVGRRERWTYRTRDGESFPVYGPWRNPALAAVWNTVGWAVLLTCWLPALDGNLVGVLAAFALGQVCRTLARKHRAVSARGALEKDRRPPIVYLRSFQDDGLFQPGTFFLANDWLRTLQEKTAEANLSEALAPFGPVVAIGRPEEEMPEVGAARIYVGDDHWQDLIKDLLSERGALAVLQGGVTKGLRWEFETVGSMLRPEQVLMFLPFGLHWSRERRAAGYAAFRGWANESLPAELPETVGDGVFFFYFATSPPWEVRVAEPGAKVPPGHPLRDVLADLKSSKALQPWRLLNLRRFFKLFLLGLLLLPISYGMKALRAHLSSESPAATPDVADARAAGAPPAVKDPPPRDEHPTRYEGKERPYHVTLGPAWAQKEADPNQDLSFSRGESLDLIVMVLKGPVDYTNAAQDHAERIRNAEGGKVGRVTVLDDRKIQLGGREWSDYKLEVVVDGNTSWHRIRCYSGDEGTFLLLANLAKNDPGLDQALTQAFDSFELPAQP